MDDQPDLMTITQAAAALGLSRSTVLSQIKRGALHAAKLGSIWVIGGAEVDRYRYAHLGRVGVASPDHPLHGRRGGGGWTKGKPRRTD